MLLGDFVPIKAIAQFCNSIGAERAAGFDLQPCLQRNIIILLRYLRFVPSCFCCSCCYCCCCCCCSCRVNTTNPNASCSRPIYLFSDVWNELYQSISQVRSKSVLDCTAAEHVSSHLSFLPLLLLFLLLLLILPRFGHGSDFSKLASSRREEQTDYVVGVSRHIIEHIIETSGLMFNYLCGTICSYYWYRLSPPTTFDTDIFGIVFPLLALHILGCNHLDMQMHGKEASGHVRGQSASSIRREGPVSSAVVPVETSLHIYTLRSLHAATLQSTGRSGTVIH